MDKITKPLSPVGSRLPDIPPSQLQPRLINVSYWAWQRDFDIGEYNVAGLHMLLTTRGELGFQVRDDEGRWREGEVSAGHLLTFFSGPANYWAASRAPVQMFQTGWYPAAGDRRRGVPSAPGIGRLPQILDVREDIDRFTHIYERLMVSLIRRPSYWQVETSSLLLQLLALCFERMVTARPGAEGEARLDEWDRLLALIEPPLWQGTVADMACEMNLSVNALIRAFRRRFGTTPQQYVLARRLWHGREGLLRGEPVKKAAYQSGFRDPLYFSRQFKRLFGVSPRQSRRDPAAIPTHKEPALSLPICRHLWAPDLETPGRYPAE
jgi:AraC-like DNA-binding protein